MPSKDPYAALGVSRTATQDEIKNAYRKLAKKHHPDLNPGNKAAEQKFKDISTAYEKIGAADARAKFDRGETEAASAGPGGFGSRRGPFYSETQDQGGRYRASFNGADIDPEIFEAIFGRRGSANPAGVDENYRMEVDFNDAVLGAEKEITLPSGKRLKVKIPPGVESGAKLRMAGQGTQGHPPGDAYIEIAVRSSREFRRDGQNLEIELPISLSEAVLGGEISAPTIHGPVMLRIPAGVSSGAKLRIKGKGVPARGDRGQGDEIVTLKIVLPEKVDSDLADAVRNWSKVHPYDPRKKEGAAP